jgi:serpin B
VGTIQHDRLSHLLNAQKNPRQQIRPKEFGVKIRVMKIITILLFLAFSIPVTVSAGTSSLVPSQQELIKGNGEFAVQLYLNLSAKEGNLFFSPFSVSSALGMTYAGARGNTAKEIKDTLHFYPPQAELPAAFRGLNTELTNNAAMTGQKLNIANALVLTGGDVSGEYKKILKDYFRSEIFRGGLEQINGWVKKKTEGKIEKILDKLSGNSVCVILNAVYFKGIWESQFNKNRTQDAPFHVSANKEVTVPLMYQTGKFRILEGNGFHALSIPYKGDDLSMVILLPDVKDGMAVLEKQLNSESLKTWLTELDKQRVRKVDLFLPKFKFETNYDLVTPFVQLGMKDAFALGIADFRGMGWAKGDLWISQIKHRAFVEVNEEGTEAAAATAVEMAGKAMDFSSEFRADHPFLFIIKDNRTSVILFMGRIVEPN